MLIFIPSTLFLTTDIQLMLFYHMGILIWIKMNIMIISFNRFKNICFKFYFASIGLILFDEENHWEVLIIYLIYCSEHGIAKSIQNGF